MISFNRPSVAIVIAAHSGRTRLSGELLADVRGKPMVQRIYERVRDVSSVQNVLVATDDACVMKAVRGFGGECVVTFSNSSGTDHFLEVMAKVDADIYINIDLDEQLIRSDDIARLAAGMLADESVRVGTLCHAINADEAVAPEAVKIVLAANGDALYFSRAPIPYPRDAEIATYLKHVAVYAYRREVLVAYAGLPDAMVQQAEGLEQLRLLSAGTRIRVFEIAPPPQRTDTLKDFKHGRALMAGGEAKLPGSLANVRLVITDVDGVLTDGGVYYDASGECLKRFHVRDGLGIRLLEENGVRVAVLSGRDSEALRKRVTDLGVSLFQFGVKDKFAACRALMERAGATPTESVCIGDDSIDLPAFEACGMSYAVADAADYVKAGATAVLSKRGGEGAFRELADEILHAQGKGRTFMTAEGFATVMSGAAQ